MTDPHPVPAEGLATDVARPCDERCATGPGWFWTRSEWAEWSNELAMSLPEEYDGDEAQEAIIGRAVLDMAQQLREALAVLGEYEDAGAKAAPYTNERALYERMCSALRGEDFPRKPPVSTVEPADADGGRE